MICNLMKIDDRWTESGIHEEAFKSIKIASEASVLRHYDPCKPLVIQSDMSEKGSESALLLVGQNLAYVSQAFTDTET